MLVLLLLLLVGLWEDVFTGGCGLTTLSFSSSMSPSSSTLAPPPLLTSASSSPPSFCCLNVSTCRILRLSSRTRSISTKSSCTCSMLAINSTYVHINDQHMWWMVSREIPASDQVSIIKGSLKTGTQLSGFLTAFHTFPAWVSGVFMGLKRIQKHSHGAKLWESSLC